MVMITSLLAIGISLLPISKWIVFQPRYYQASVYMYWLFDIARGMLATFFAYLIAGWGAAYAAAILAVFISLFLERNNTFAVAAGAILVLSPILILCGVVVFVLSLLSTKYYFLSTYLTVAAVVILGLVFAVHLAVWGTIVLLGFIVCWDQRHSLRRYKRGLAKKIHW
jgi:glycerol-3-phosphate acyltransferase PlsY